MKALKPEIPTTPTVLPVIIDMQKASGVDCQLIWDDTQILFYPILPCIVEELTIVEKSLELSAETHYVRKSVRRSRALFATFERGDKRIGVTFQGFLDVILKALIAANKTFSVKDLRISNSKYPDFPAPDFKAMYGFRFSQRELLESALIKNRSGLIGAATRYGKCLSINELCLKYDYTIVRAADVKNGDLLMGPDGLPRKVTGCIRGTDPMYRITPNKGNPFTCNADHILSLKLTGGVKFGGYRKNDIINISVKDYLTKSKTFKHVTKLYYAPLEFSEKDLPFDPWIVGVWIGDGCFNGDGIITKPDRNVQRGIIDWAERNGYPWRYRTSNTENDSIRVRRRSNETGISACNPFKHISRLCIKDNEKYIPVEYLTASREQRLELLAGLIDTDGYSNNGLGYEITTKYKLLADCITQLCRGLGFRVTYKPTIKTIKALGFSGTYYRIHISGPLNLIPCRGHKKVYSVKGRVDPTVTGFTVEYIGEGEYAGFELEGPDHLFLMWDHLVTHNTTLLVNTLRAFPSLSTVVVAPGVDLVSQLYADITGPRGVKGREVKLICSGRGRVPSQEPDGITVCSADSLHLCDPGSTELLLADEPHALVTSTRLGVIDGFLKARRYGYGATLKGRFDGRDKLITGIFGPVLAERTYLEAVAEGAICPLNIIMFQIELTPHEFYNRDTAYNELLFQNREMANLLRRICEEVVPAEWQTMIFIKNEAQADMYLEAIGTEHTIAMAKKMTKKEREEVNARMKANEIKRCLCTDIYVQGVTFSDARVLINCEAGGNNTTAIQKPGRLAEIRPGKKCGIIIDFEFVRASGYTAKDYEGDQTAALIADSRNRVCAYEEKGYGIYRTRTVEETKQVFDSLI